MRLDVQTLGVVLLFSTAIQAILMTVYATVIRRYPGVNLWSYSNVVISIGTALNLFSNSIPLVMSGVFGNILLILGASLLYYGTVLFLNQRPNRWLVWTPPLLGLCLMFYFVYIQNNYNFRALSLSILLAPASLMIMFLLLGNPSHRRNPSYWLAGGTFGIYGAFLVIRIPLLIFVEPSVDIFASTPLQITNLLFSIFSIISWTMGFIVMVTYRMSFELNEKNIQIRQALQRSDELLLNILPPEIAQRMKNGERELADYFLEVSVLFADIVNFTVISQNISPEQVVKNLNLIFKEFDELAQKYGLEKIKTIGDCYMAVSGLPIPNVDCARKAADMALEMQTIAKSLSLDGKTPLQLRIGLHMGDVVAGVIGSAKFAYDLWGDTVNTASRMESFSEPEKIQCTKSMYQRLKTLYAFEPRGEINVKGKGLMEAYFLTGKK